MKSVALLMALIFTLQMANAQKLDRDSLQRFALRLVKQARLKSTIGKVAIAPFVEHNGKTSEAGIFLANRFSIPVENIDSLTVINPDNLIGILASNKIRHDTALDLNSIMKLSAIDQIDAVIEGRLEFNLEESKFQLRVRIYSTRFRGVTFASDERDFTIDDMLKNVLARSSDQTHVHKSSLLPGSAALTNSDCQKEKTGEVLFTSSYSDGITVIVFKSKKAAQSYTHKELPRKNSYNNDWRDDNNDGWRDDDDDNNGWGYNNGGWNARKLQPFEPRTGVGVTSPTSQFAIYLVKELFRNSKQPRWNLSVPLPAQSTVSAFRFEEGEYYFRIFYTEGSQKEVQANVRQFTVTKCEMTSVLLRR